MTHSTQVERWVVSDWCHRLRQPRTVALGCGKLFAAMWVIQSSGVCGASYVTLAPKDFTSYLKGALRIPWQVGVLPRRPD